MSEHAHVPVCAPVPVCVRVRVCVCLTHQYSNEPYVHATIDPGRLQIRHIRGKSLKAPNRMGGNMFEHCLIASCSNCYICAVEF